MVKFKALHFPHVCRWLNQQMRERLMEPIQSFGGNDFLKWEMWIFEEEMFWHLFYLLAYTIPKSALQVYGSLAISLGPVVVCEVVQCGIVLFGVERSRDLFREPSGNRETQEDCLFSSLPRPQSYGTMYISKGSTVSQFILTFSFFSLGTHIFWFSIFAFVTGPTLRKSPTLEGELTSTTTFLFLLGLILGKNFPL